MWIKHKTKQDTTLLDIASQFRVKQWLVLLEHPKNKKYKALARKGQPIPKGSEVYVIDPKVKVYVIKLKGKTQLVTEKDWQAHVKKMTEAMATGLDVMQRALLRGQRRHDFQTDLNKKSPFLSFFLQSWVGQQGREPVAARRIAEGAVVALERVVKRKEYGKFEDAMRFAEKCIDTYHKKIGEWIKQQTGSAENWATGLGYVKTFSFAIFAVTATAAIAPAGMAATVGTGVGVGGGTSFLMTLSEIVGKDMYGDSNDNANAANDLIRDTIVGGVTGGLGAGFSKFLGTSVVPKIAERITSAPIARQLAVRFFQTGPGAKIVMRIITTLENRAIATLGKEGAKSMMIDKLVRDRILEPVIAGVLKMGVAGVSSQIKGRFKSGKWPGWCEKFISQNWSKVKDLKSEDAVAGLLADAGVKEEKMLLELFGVLIVTQLKPIEKAMLEILEQEMRKQDVGRKAA